MAEEDIKEVASIKFSIYSNEEILQMSVVKLDNPKRCGPGSGTGSVYDSRMGATDDGETCETCHQTAENCPGHFGHIELNEPIINPLYYKDVINFLRCFCLTCSRLLLLEGQISLGKLNRFSGNSRFTRVLEKLTKVQVCCHCDADQPEIKFCTTDNTVAAVYPDTEESKKVKVSITLSVDDILKVFEGIKDCDIKLIGYDPTLVHPKKMIMRSLPVLPPADRPYVKQDGHICDDDLTNQYMEIIKANNHLIGEECMKSETKKQKELQTLKFRIATLFNNGKGKAKHTTNSRPIKGFKERLAGKDGQLRNNMMGKRVNQSGRTVIGPDPTLAMNELAVPREMAKILTIPVRVAPYNLKEMNRVVNAGEANYVLKGQTNTRINLKKALFRNGTTLLMGDVIYRGDTEIIVLTGKEPLEAGDHVKRGDEFIKDLRFPEKKSYEVFIGDVVERQLVNGDSLLLNRQPTLHEGSMQGMQVVIKDCKTLRINLSICKSFNADFDGDEIDTTLSLEQGAANSCWINSVTP
jgi:DNA-directed RNA polymerase beta' subunit